MTPAEFKAKRARFTGKESSSYQDHFSDLCQVLGVPTPIQAAPTGNDTFCFQKRVVKDAEFFTFDDSGRVAETPDNERGFADVWKKECFGWEYKGPGEDLEKAYKQLLRYRESLLNPPLLVVCDFDRFVVCTNFNGAVQERKNLNDLRERWLNPPEWTQTRVLEFPGSVDGPWARYLECGGKRSATPLSLGTSAESQSAVAANALPAHSKIGVVRYPRLEPRDAECAAEEAKATPVNKPKPSRSKQADKML